MARDVERKPASDFWVSHANDDIGGDCFSYVAMTQKFFSNFFGNDAK